MDVKDLKNRISSEDKIKKILEDLGMKHIKDSGKYFSCCMPDGDNKKSTIIYKESLEVEAYTRNIEDENGYKNIISLVMYIKKMYFSHAIKWICDVCDFDYYGRDYKKLDILSFFEELDSLNTNSESEDDVKLQPISENILNYYKKFPNKQFYYDGISKEAQIEFEVGFDHMTERITIPIRDDIGNLIGVKGRCLTKNEESEENKYMYIERCNKSKIVFNLHRALPYIKEQGYVIVAESEKAPMQGFSNGIKNVVSIGGHILSSHQAKKINHLGVPVVFAYDDKADYITKNIDGKLVEVKDEDFYLREREKILSSQKVYAIIDSHNEILGEKDSPFDNLDMWDDLLGMKRLLT